MLSADTRQISHTYTLGSLLLSFLRAQRVFYYTSEANTLLTSIQKSSRHEKGAAAHQVAIIAHITKGS